MSTAEEVNLEMMRSLTEWGIQPNLCREHHNFFTKALHSAKTCFHGEKHSYLDDSSDDDEEESLDLNSDFPRDPKDAIRHILKSELNSSRSKFQFFDDSLETKYGKTRRDVRWFLPPFKAHPLRRGNFIIGFSPSKKQEYTKFKMTELDPLTRYTAEDVTKSEYYFAMFCDENFIGGCAFEAIVCCYAIYHAPCFSCKARRTLRWNGGSRSTSSWRDIECIHCNSAYEIKSKCSTEIVSRNLTQNHIPGGSFYLYHKNRQKSSRSRNTASNNYLVLVSRQSTYDRSGEKVWPVDIAEIEYVLPRLKDRSFAPGERYISIGSFIKIKKNTQTNWFKIPASICDIESVGIMHIVKEVFIDYFSLDEWNRLYLRQDLPQENTLQGSVSQDGGNSELKGKNEKKDVSHEYLDEVHRLRDEIIKLKLGGDDDDWENNYSD